MSANFQPTALPAQSRAELECEAQSRARSNDMHRSTAPALFTASRIAAALGKTPQAVRNLLVETPASGAVVVQGIEAAAWTIAALPDALRTRLNDESGRRGCRDVEAMLSDDLKEWEPALPISEIVQDDINQAHKLREALRPWLMQRHELGLSTAEIEHRGVTDYARMFGHRISGRYWRELFARTLHRDGGAENWNRLELYLPNNPKRRQAPSRIVSEALAEEFGELESFIRACGNPCAPSETEQRAIWTLALGKYASMVSAGFPSKRAARRVRSFLFAKAQFLANSRDALLKAFERKRDALEKAAGDPKALRDGRENNGERFDLPDDDRDLLIHRAVFYYRGDVAPAWRDCVRYGFSAAVKQRYAEHAKRKSHVPASVMESVSGEVAVLTVMHQGTRAFDSIKGHVTRSYEGIFSRDCFSADDFTMPVYFYVPDGKGWFTLTRGQILLFIDFRTLRIVGFSLQPDRNYSSLTIRSLCTHVFAEHGLPKVLQFERGIWESSTLLKGRNHAAMEFTETVQGLREFGIHFIHSIRPRSKTVERVGGLLQDLMEGEPGYCGREERKDAPESLRKQMAEVSARKVHPSAYFYSYDQWHQRLGEIIDRYNAEPQQGRILDNKSPDVAFSEFANTDDPPMEFGAGARYLLAHHKEAQHITLNGFYFKIGKTRYQYAGAEIAHLAEKRAEMLTWFDPENPETAIVTDMNRRNPICVPRCNEPSALECIVSPGSGTLAAELKRMEDQASYMKARFRAVKSKFPMPQRRTLADSHTIITGQRIEIAKAGHQKASEARRERGAANKDKARRLGIDPVLVGGGDDDAEALAIIAEAKRMGARERLESVSPNPNQ